MTRKCWFLAFAFAATICATQRYQTSGMVIAIDPAHQSVTVSNDAIPGYMDAMVMTYRVRASKELADLKPGARVDFTLVVGKSP